MAFSDTFGIIKDYYDIGCHLYPRQPMADKTKWITEWSMMEWFTGSLKGILQKTDTKLNHCVGIQVLVLQDILGIALA